jgi:hypothetical protein
MQPNLCEPAAEIRSDLQKATAVPVKDPTAFDQNVAVFRTLRERYPDDLFVHEGYQDAVEQFGIEGHLRRLTEDYQVLSTQHSGDLKYRYLYARSLIGRNTRAAIQQMVEIVADHPDFAPAHRALAEIYASETFGDVEKGKAERERFLALCPGPVLRQRPGALPEPSPLIDQAERLLAGNGDPDRVAEMALQGIRADEWRMQRIRPFDWYSADYKRQNQRQLQAEYWRVWSIQVRCYRKAHHPEKADALLAMMEEHAPPLGKDSAPSAWDASLLLAHLYVEGNQKQQAAQKLDSLQRFLAEHPDPRRASQLEELHKLIGVTGSNEVK